MTTTLSLKYAAPTPGLWRRAMHTLLAVLPCAIRGLSAGLGGPVDSDGYVRSLDPYLQSLWSQILAAAEAALFTASAPPPDLGHADVDADTALDLAFVALLRSLVETSTAGAALAPQPARVAEDASGAPSTPALPLHTIPPQHLASLLGLLRRASLAGPRLDGAVLHGSRLQTGLYCFHAVLDLAPLWEAQGGDSVHALVGACGAVLDRYVALDAEATGELPAEVTLEAACVLDALAATVTPFRRAAATQVFETLVRCIACKHVAIKAPLQAVLARYAALLHCDRVGSMS